MTWLAPGLAAESTQLTLIVAAIAGGLALSLWQARRDALSPWHVLAAMPLGIVGAGIVGHLVHIALVGGISELASPRAWRVWAGGYNSIGVYLGAAAGALLTWRLRRQAIGPLADACAPGVLLGAAVARLGCVWAGCDFGRPVDSPGAGPTLAYPPRSSAWRALGPSSDDAGWTAALHPFPLYESLPLVALVAMLAWRPSLFGARPGQRASGCAAVFFSVRFVAEGFRGGVSATWADLTALQCIALLGAAGFAALWMRTRRSW